jgi:hypothetical protein
MAAGCDLAQYGHAQVRRPLPTHCLSKACQNKTRLNNTCMHKACLSATFGWKAAKARGLLLVAAAPGEPTAPEPSPGRFKARCFPPPAAGMRLYSCAHAVQASWDFHTRRSSDKPSAEGRAARRRGGSATALTRSAGSPVRPGWPPWRCPPRPPPTAPRHLESCAKQSSNGQGWDGQKRSMMAVGMAGKNPKWPGSAGADAALRQAEDVVVVRLPDLDAGLTLAAMATMAEDRRVAAAGAPGPPRGVCTRGIMACASTATVHVGVASCARRNDTDQRRVQWRANATACNDTPRAQRSTLSGSSARRCSRPRAVARSSATPASAAPSGRARAAGSPCSKASSAVALQPPAVAPQARAPQARAPVRCPAQSLAAHHSQMSH